MQTEIAARGAAGAVRKGKEGFLSFYTRGEEIGNAVSHIAGGALGLAAWIVLALAAADTAALIGVSLFGLGAVALYTMSALYHFLPDGRAKGVLRVFDHCTIFLLIAGTYSAYCLTALYGTAAGRGVLIAQWVLAAAGIALNAAAMDRRAVKAVSMVLYCVAGWMALFVIGPLRAAVGPASFWLLFAGGAAYTVGIVFFALGKRVRWFHFVWHLFDLAGTALQFASLLLLLSA